jgi:signal transduction histidine kinase
MVASSEGHDMPGHDAGRTGPARLPTRRPRVSRILLAVTSLLAVGAILAAEEALGLNSQVVHAALAVGLGLAVAMLVATMLDLRAAEVRTDAALARAVSAETAQRARADELARLLTEVRSVQEQLVQASRLGAVGELAAAVAHEVNNPLTGILGFAELLASELPVDDPRHEEAVVIRDEAIRARSIVKALLEFARPRTPQRLSTDLNALALTTVDLVRFRVHETGIRIVEDYSDLPPLEADPDALKQVLLNLINNAIEAMPEGGELGVSTRSGRDRAGLVVRDTGPGMDAKTRSRVFTPSFSTRATTGVGTGLRLPVSLQIVESHGGSIEVESEPGSGTVFTVWLPLTTTALDGGMTVRDGESAEDRTPPVETNPSEVGPRPAEGADLESSTVTRDAGRAAFA